MTSVNDIAAELLLTDALTPNDAETLHPDYYTVDADDIAYLVQTVLDLAELKQRIAVGYVAPDGDVQPIGGATTSGFRDLHAAKQRAKSYNAEVDMIRYVPIQQLYTDWKKIND